MAKWSKAKAGLETKLPPLTTDQPSRGPNWHKIGQRENPEPTPSWTVIWNTSRHADASNKAQHMTEEAAIDCARRFLRLGFIVYSIKDASGVETMNEATINKQLKPAPLPETPARFTRRALSSDD